MWCLPWWDRVRERIGRASLVQHCLANCGLLPGQWTSCHGNPAKLCRAHPDSLQDQEMPGLPRVLHCTCTHRINNTWLSHIKQVRKSRPFLMENVCRILLVCYLKALSVSWCSSLLARSHSSPSVQGPFPQYSLNSRLGLNTWASAPSATQHDSTTWV